MSSKVIEATKMIFLKSDRNDKNEFFTKFLFFVK